MTEAIVQVDRLIFSYGAVQVLHEISFNLTRAKSWGCSVQTGREEHPRPAAKWVKNPPYIPN